MPEVNWLVLNANEILSKQQKTYFGNSHVIDNVVFLEVKWEDTGKCFCGSTFFLI